jgi:hypothetical protein
VWMSRTSDLTNGASHTTSLARRRFPATIQRLHASRFQRLDALGFERERDVKGEKGQSREERLEPPPLLAEAGSGCWAWPTVAGSGCWERVAAAHGCVQGRR